MLPRILPTHADLIPGPLTALPETGTLPTHDAFPAEPAILWPVWLFPAAPAAYHAVAVLIRVLLLLVVAFVAWVHLIAATKSEPPVGLGIVFAAAAVWELCPRYEAERLALPPWS